MLWSIINQRLEFGFFDTVGGTVVPSDLSASLFPAAFSAVNTPLINGVDNGAGAGGPLTLGGSNGGATPVAGRQGSAVERGGSVGVVPPGRNVGGALPAGPVPNSGGARSGCRVGGFSCGVPKRCLN